MSCDSSSEDHDEMEKKKPKLTSDKGCSLPPATFSIERAATANKELGDLQFEIKALKLCIYNCQSDNPLSPDGEDEVVQRYVQIYAGLDRKSLQSVLVSLQSKGTAAFLSTSNPLYSVEGILEWLDRRKLIPPLDTPLTPQRLTKPAVVLMNREGSKKQFQETTAGRLKNREDSDKGCHPHVICMGAPGTGKSLLADLGLSILQESEDNALRTLAKRCPVEIRISFNGDTIFDKETDFGMMGGQSAVARRMLASYFGFRLARLSPYSVVGIQQLTIENCIDAILADHRRRNSETLGPSEDVLVYLAIDDVTPIFDSGVPSDKDKRYLKSILDSLSSLYSRTSGYFFVAMVTGNVYGATTSVIKETHRSFENLATPLLSLEQSIQMTKAVLKEDEVPICVQLLFSDIGGIPDFVRFAIDGLQRIPSRDELLATSVNQLRSRIKNNMTDRYQLACSDPFMLKEVIPRALLRTPLPRNFRFVANGQSLRDLEDQGKAFVVDSEGGKCMIVLPLLTLEAIAAESTMLQGLIADLVSLPSASWDGWETFCMRYHAVLVTLHSHMYRLNSLTEPPPPLRIGDLFRGAYIGAGVKDVCIKTPSSVSLEAPAKFVKLKQRFPDTEGSAIDKYDGSEVYLNSPGASFADGVVPLQMDDSELGSIQISSGDSDANSPTLGCYIHCRYTANGETQFDLRATINENNKKIGDVNEKLAKRCEQMPFPKSLTVFVSNRKLVVSKNEESLNGTVGTDETIQHEEFDSEHGIGWNDVVITRNQLPGYFSRTFADRLHLMLGVWDGKGK